jgi:hypothetical protein
MTAPIELRQREVEDLLREIHGLTYSRARQLMRADVMPRLIVPGITQRRWLRADVIAFDVSAWLRQTAAHQGQANSAVASPCAAADSTCP